MECTECLVISRARENLHKKSIDKSVRKIGKILNIFEYSKNLRVKHSSNTKNNSEWKILRISESFKKFYDSKIFIIFVEIGCIYDIPLASI